MQPRNYTERIIDIEGWQVHLASYELEGTWHCRADNVSPGATLARAAGATKEEAEAEALSKSRHLLSKTRRHAV